MEHLVEVFFLLLAGHCLADYPLQGDFLATAKNHRTDVGRVLWVWALPSHGVIHGAFVYVITGAPMLGAMEVVAHCIIDRAKCANRITYGQDQILHITCKVIWLAIYAQLPQ